MIRGIEMTAFVLGLVVGLFIALMVVMSLRQPHKTDIPFINAFNGNYSILHLKPNERGYVEEWIKPEEEPQPLTIEEFEKVKEQLRKRKREGEK